MNPSLRTSLPIIMVASVGSLGLMLTTLLVGGWAAVHGYSESQLANLASIELVGFAAGSVLTALLLHRVSWHLMLWAGCLLLIAFNALSMGEADYVRLAAYRFTVEVGGGLLMATGYAAIGDSNNPDRLFAQTLVLVMIFSILAFVILPELVVTHGPEAVYIAQGVAVVVAVLFVPFFPDRGWRKNPAAAGADSSLPLPANPAMLTLALLSVGVFYMGEAVLFALAERIAAYIGIGIEETGNYLAIAMVFSTAGAFVAALVSIRWGRALPLLTGLLSFMVGFGFLALFTETGFMISIFLTQFCFSFALVYVLLLAVEFDVRGRFAAFIPAVQAAGYATGPAVLALFLNGTGYMAVVWIGCACMLACLLIGVPQALMLDRLDSAASHPSRKPIDPIKVTAQP